jgi:hypothetical protein
VDNFVDSSPWMARQPSKIKGLAIKPRKMLPQQTFQNQRLSAAIGFVAEARAKFAQQHMFCA